jgi:hypothetical protein
MALPFSVHYPFLPFLPNPLTMKNQFLPFLLTCFTLFSSYSVSIAQTLNLRTAHSYVLFTSTGAVGSTGVSEITGNIGTNNGAITGFELPTTLSGNIDSGNASTIQCSTDVRAAYDQLFNTAATSSSHTPTFGGGETLFPGVYEIAAAGSVAGSLTLDAQGDPNAVFIFKFGGAFTTGAATTINLINGALSCNIFWGAEGAIAMAAVTSMKGTLIANNGAISMGAGGTLDGRMFSTTGAASVYDVSISLPPCSLVILPIELLSFSANCSMQQTVLKWNTSTETNNHFFTIERSIQRNIWQVLGTVAGGGNSSSLQSYTYIDQLPDKRSSVYRLKQTDFDGKNKYSDVVIVKNCGVNGMNHLTIYPNPTYGKFNLLFSGNITRVNSITVFNSQGLKIYESPGFQSTFNLSGNPPGMYIMQVKYNDETINIKIVIEK